MPIHVSIEQEELRGISRTVAEIHWLLLILILVYLIFGGVANENEPAISSSLFFYAALVMAFRYANFFRTESRWKIDRKSTRLNSSHGYISYAVFCLKKKNSKA